MPPSVNTRALLAALLQFEVDDGYNMIEGDMDPGSQVLSADSSFILTVRNVSKDEW